MLDAHARPAVSFRALVRFVLLGSLLAVTVIIGLVAMHTLNLHGTPAAHASASVMKMIEGGQAHPGAEADQMSNGQGDLALEVNCGDCGMDDHQGMAMACVLALLIALLLLTPPSLLRGRTGAALRSRSLLRLLDEAPPRPPSLALLCISRT